MDKELLRSDLIWVINNFIFKLLTARKEEASRQNIALRLPQPLNIAHQKAHKRLYLTEINKVLLWLVKKIYYFLLLVLLHQKKPCSWYLAFKWNSFSSISSSYISFIMYLRARKRSSWLQNTDEVCLFIYFYNTFIWSSVTIKHSTDPALPIEGMRNCVWTYSVIHVQQKNLTFDYFLVHLVASA